jgi:uracil-DNA glycosylase family protein
MPLLAQLEAARAAAASCTACDLYRNATQTVFGEGPVPAPLMLVGEQPGDREDVAGHPFVGPAGQLLDRALGEAEIVRENVFVTNVVKHFKWRPAPGGKRRLHEKPNAVEVRACRPWLETELGLVQPKLLVLLGSTAAQSVLGPSFRVTRDGGRVFPSPIEGVAPAGVLATLHPSAVLRSRSSEEREEGLRTLVRDLRKAAQLSRPDAAPRVRPRTG